MKKLKDLIYDYNDIVVAILIIILAGAIISWRINYIIAYPKYLAEQTAGEISDDINLDDIDLSLSDIEDINDNPEDIVSDPASGPPAEDPQDAEPPNTDDEGEFVTAQDASFTVPPGVSGTKIAQLLYEENLVESSQQFITAVAKKNAETKLMAGTFNIPAGSTVEDIVNILTR
nr:hypothetical protein [Clostridia bacterium]